MTSSLTSEKGQATSATLGDLRQKKERGLLRDSFQGALLFAFFVWLPFFLFSMMEIALGHTEPLIGGLVENVLVMTAMGFFYSVFVIAPSLLLFLFLKGALKKRFLLQHRELCFVGFFGGACELLLVQNYLALNALTLEQIGLLLTAAGMAIAVLVFLLAKRMLHGQTTSTRGCTSAF